VASGMMRAGFIFCFRFLIRCFHEKKVLGNSFMDKPPRKIDNAFPRSNVLEALGELLPLKAVLMVLGTTVAIVLGYYFSLFAIHGFDRDFLEINKCVEAGGRWNHKLRVCEKIPGTYIPAELEVLQY